MLPGQACSLQVPAARLSDRGSKFNSAMAYCKFQADQLFTGYRFLDGPHILVTDEKGTILDIMAGEADDNTQRFSGILMPGHVNTHCHLELSYLRNRMLPGQGLTRFISSVMQLPRPEPQERTRQMALADREMYRNGIVATGDISNGPYSMEQKANSAIRWYNFLEIINLDDAKAEEQVERYRRMADEFMQTLSHGSAAVLSPHAIYSVSPRTFALINENTGGKTITIHNQECAGEDELFIKGKGSFVDFYRGIGRPSMPFPVSGKSSIRTWLPYFNNGQTIVLVHNTYMPEEDILYANAYALQNGLQLIYCLCPNANLYIEERLPPVDLFVKHNCTVALGTDSYGSNRQLSITSEMAAIRNNFPYIGLSELLQWATLNGAKALQWGNEIGSFEKGCRPGVVLLQNDLSASQRVI